MDCHSKKAALLFLACEANPDTRLCILSPNLTQQSQAPQHRQILMQTVVANANNEHLEGEAQKEQTVPNRGGRDDQPAAIVASIDYRSQAKMNIITTLKLKLTRTGCKYF